MDEGIKKKEKKEGIQERRIKRKIWIKILHFIELLITYLVLAFLTEKK